MYYLHLFTSIGLAVLASLSFFATNVDDSITVSLMLVPGVPALLHLFSFIQIKRGAEQLANGQENEPLVLLATARSAITSTHNTTMILAVVFGAIPVLVSLTGLLTNSSVIMNIEGEHILYVAMATTISMVITYLTRQVSNIFLNSTPLPQ